MVSIDLTNDASQTKVEVTTSPSINEDALHIDAAEDASEITKGMRSTY